MFRIIVIFLISSTGVYASSSFGRIYLKSITTINGSVLKLSDIAGFDKEIQDRVIRNDIVKPEKIQAKDLEMHFKGISVLGKECIVLPLNKKTSFQDLEDSLLQEMLRIGMDISKMKLQYAGKDILLPEDKAILSWGKFSNDFLPGKRIFTLGVYFENKLIHTYRLPFTVSIKAHAYIVTRDIKKGKILDDSDVALKEIYLDENPKNFLSESPVSQTALSSMNEGDLMRKKHTRKIFPVEKGSEVTIVYTLKNITVKGKGRAVVSGNFGEEVVVDTRNGKKITTRVADKGVVVVNQ